MKNSDIKRIINEKYSSGECEFDDEGRAIINMVVKNDDGFLSVYSRHNTPTISSEVAEFIEGSAHYFKPNQPLTLRIHSNTIDEEEKNVYRSAIKEHYLKKYIENKNEFRFNIIAVIFLMLAGIIALVLSFRVEHHIWSEVIDIAAWVFLWEAVDIFFFKNRASNINRKRYISYISMKVEYFPLG